MFQKLFTESIIKALKKVEGNISITNKQMSVLGKIDGELRPARYRAQVDAAQHYQTHTFPHLLNLT